MQFPDPLLRGTLVKRYKRFLADVTLADATLDSAPDGLITAHCANPGSMLGLNAPGSEVWLSPARNPDRKLRYSWELVRVDGGLVSINTAHPNKLVEEAINAGTIGELGGYDTIRREVRYGKNSRIDLLLEGAGRPDCYVEVKNVTLKRDTAGDQAGGVAEFPDSVTKRGAKHLAELSDMVAAGHRAVMVYVIQREDCSHFSLADDIDPAYGAAFAAARAAGVEAIAYACNISVDGIHIAAPLPIFPLAIAT
ncbi:MAG: DNA/RNA nuclease SfsA [Alphaproteobacteria bacterium]|nr:DNA/RNA nuclease SfsA [Alphaproteobacteria bacterium]